MPVKCVLTIFFLFFRCVILVMHLGAVSPPMRILLWCFISFSRETHLLFLFFKRYSACLFFGTVACSQNNSETTSLKLDGLIHLFLDLWRAKEAWDFSWWLECLLLWQNRWTGESLFILTNYIYNLKVYPS